MALSYFGLINYPVHALTFVPVASRTATIQSIKISQVWAFYTKNRCRSTLATVFSFCIIGYCFRFMYYCGGLSGKIRSTNNRFKTTFRSFMVKAHEGMHERRQSQADWCASSGYEITNFAEAESRDWRNPIQSRDEKV